MEEPKLNGIYCPKCKSGLYDTNPLTLLLSNPPQKKVHCVECGYSSTRFLLENTQMKPKNNTDAKKAIKVMLMGNDNTLFVIEGFEEKNITEQALRNYIMMHWEGLYGKGSVDIKLIGKEYLITTDVNTVKVTWSWVTSYKISK